MIARGERGSILRCEESLRASSLLRGARWWRGTISGCDIRASGGDGPDEGVAQVAMDPRTDPRNMPTRRIARHIEELLRTIDEAVKTSDWATVSRVANDVLAMDPSHADALVYQEAAARALALPGEEVGPRARRRWTEEEEAFLRAEAGRRPVREIARELDRSPDSVRHRAYGMGLSLRYRRASRGRNDVSEDAPEGPAAQEA